MSCVFAGTFDPITKGHEEIINRCIKKYGGVLVVVGENADKTHTFNEGQRVEFIEKTFEGNDNVKVIRYSALREGFYDYLLDNGYKYYVRGIRNKKDYKYEKYYVKKNKNLYSFIKTVFFKAKDYKIVSATLVKELLKEQKADDYLPDNSREIIKKVYREINSIE